MAQDQTDWILASIAPDSRPQDVGTSRKFGRYETAVKASKRGGWLDDGAAGF